MPTANNPEAALISRIPVFDDARKSDYLGYRAMGFTIREACSLANVRQQTVMHWRKSDSEFATWEGPRIRDLQDSVADDLIRNQFNRNMHLSMSVDFKLLRKAALEGLDSLTKAELLMMRTVTNKYGPQELLAMKRLLGDQNLGEDFESPTVNVYIDRVVLDDAEAKRAGARALLERHIVSQRAIDVESRLIEAEEAS